jgi:hypothetical protein
MKKILFILMSIAAIAAINTVPSLQKFEAPVNVVVPRDTVAGIAIRNTATLGCVIIDYRNKSISLSWDVKAFNEDSVPIGLIPTYVKEQKATPNIFIAPDGSTAAWSESELLAKYGVKDSDSTYSYDADGLPVLTRNDLKDGWSFYMEKSKQAVPLFNLFKAAGNRAASEKRLSRN